MRLKDWVDAVVRRPTEGYTSFAVERPAGDGPSRFIPEQTYVEIRLVQMQLRDERRLWREFVPLASVVTELQFAGRREVVPFVVGPDLLADAPNRDKGELVEFFNRRVAGPFPYAGDDLVIFAGLAALETGNWANRALSLLGTVASAFDVTRMSGYLDVAGALTGALQGLLGMEGVEERIGIQRSFSTPADGAGAVPDGALHPTFQVFINSPLAEFPRARCQTFSIQEGRLHEADRPFTAADFIVLELVPLAKRPDYASFDFHRVHWRAIEKYVMEGREDDAWNRLTLLAADLATSDDLVLGHRDALLEEYGDRLRALIERRAKVFRRGGSQGLKGVRVAFDEEDLGEAALRRAPASPRTPEQMLTAAVR